MDDRRPADQGTADERHALGGQHAPEDRAMPKDRSVPDDPAARPRIDVGPVGTITFLFTDVDDGGALWEQEPERMTNVVARIDELLRRAAHAHDGYLFKTVADATYAAFDTAPDALRTAVHAQRLLGEEPWPTGLAPRVRMALHTGAAEHRDGDYFGPPLNRVARLLATGHGGQVLLTQATYDLVRDELGAEEELCDLGEHRLKDLARPERVYQVVAPDLERDFPPLRTLDRRPNNLPIQATPFIGREREAADLRARLLRPDVHLLTLTGPGGAGKTRLALQVAADLLDHFEDGVFAVMLAPVTDPARVGVTIAQTLGIPEGSTPPLAGGTSGGGTSGGDPSDVGPSDADGHLARLTAYLRDRQMLLVLDNFEQVAEAVPLIAELLATCPRLKLLVTSRAVLRVYGEHDVPVPPLSLPDRRRLPPPEQLTQFEAVHLFVERTQAVKPDFQVTNENAPAVAEICHRLEGLPLAIELAAARVRLLPPRAMLARLERRLPLLTGGAQNLPARQRTLRGAIAWSYDLLAPDEQVLFRALAVFVGGWSLDAAERVASGEGPVASGESVTSLPAPHYPLRDPLERLESLVDKSLVRQASLSGEPRFSMLETIREFGLEQLEATGELAAASERHVQTFLALAESAEPHLRAAGQAEWLPRLELEHNNLRAALSWSLRGGGDPVAGARLGTALWWFWYVHGHLSEGRGWLEEALPAATGELRLRALDGAGSLAHAQGDYDRATDRYGELLRLAREAGDLHGTARGLGCLGLVAQYRGDDARMAALHEEALPLFRQLGDRWNVAWSLGFLGTAAHRAGDDVRAVALHEESLALLRQVGDDWGMARALYNLGLIAQEQGAYGRAAALHEEGLALARGLGDKRRIARQYDCLAQVARARGEYATSLDLWRESLLLRRDLGDRRGVVDCLEGLASVAAGIGERERAARLYGAAAAQRELLGAPPTASGRPAGSTVPGGTADSSTGPLAHAWTAGRSMPLDAAIAEALAVDVLLETA